MAYFLVCRSIRERLDWGFWCESSPKKGGEVWRVGSWQNAEFGRVVAGLGGGYKKLGTGNENTL